MFSDAEFCFPNVNCLGHEEFHLASVVALLLLESFDGQLLRVERYQDVPVILHLHILCRDLNIKKQREKTMSL